MAEPVEAVVISGPRKGKIVWLTEEEGTFYEVAEEGFKPLDEIAPLERRVDALAEGLRELRATVTTRLEGLESQMADVCQRLIRLEAFREAHRTQMQADLEQFKLEVERLLSK